MRGIYFLFFLCFFVTSRVDLKVFRVALLRYSVFSPSNPPNLEMDIISGISSDDYGREAPCESDLHIPSMIQPTTKRICKYGQRYSRIDLGEYQSVFHRIMESTSFTTFIYDLSRTFPTMQFSPWLPFWILGILIDFLYYLGLEILVSCDQVRPRASEYHQALIFTSYSIRTRSQT